MGRTEKSKLASMLNCFSFFKTFNMRHCHSDRKHKHTLGMEYKRSLVKTIVFYYHKLFMGIFSTHHSCCSLETPAGVVMQRFLCLAMKKLN